MAAVASPTYADSGRSRPVRERLLGAVHAMAGRMEEELQVTASRISVPMVLLLFALGQLGGCASLCITGTWWVSRLSFRVEQLEDKDKERADQLELQRLWIQSTREKLAEHGWSMPSAIDIRPSRKDGE